MMKKFLKWTAIILGSLVVLAVIAFNVMKSQTKKHSPEAIETIAINDTEIEVKYCRPFKKGRDIFGGLVPYGEVWRTGANEATTFKTSTDIKIGETMVPAGEYTLWTIPNKDQWEIIINDHEYGWGVGYSFPPKASREAQYDIANVKVPVEPLPNEVEQFTIKFSDDMHMHLMWDKTMVSVPIEPA